MTSRTGARASDFETTYLRTYPRVVRSAWAICRDPGRAEEHAQEAFARAYARWWTLGRSDHAVAWVHRVAINLAIDDVRRRRRYSSQPPPDTGEPAATPVDAVVLVEQLARLPRRQREAVILRVVEDLAEQDVAALMGVSTGTVKVHKKRGLERLRVLLGHEQGARHG